MHFLVGLGTLLVLIVGPLMVGITGILRAHQRHEMAVSDQARPWNLAQTINSAVLYALSFNLVFFVQELFLVLPKALTPGLRPTLFHNNHSWTGDNPIAHLFQGTGALAIFLGAIACALLLRRLSAGSTHVRLFLIWLTFNGCLQSLPQVVIGSIEPENDVGMAMDYLHLGAAAKLSAAIAALIAIPAVALWLRRPLLSLAETPAAVANPRARTTFMFRIATAPALAAILLIIPFRVPRPFTEVVMVPVVVTVTGLLWLQAGAWAATDAAAAEQRDMRPNFYAIVALLLLLLIFQLVLRPGIRFY
jgi:hypothetical protein